MNGNTSFQGQLAEVFPGPPSAWNAGSLLSFSALQECVCVPF